jgi:hypothetical protein
VVIGVATTLMSVVLAGCGLSLLAQARHSSVVGTAAQWTWPISERPALGALE